MNLAYATTSEEFYPSFRRVSSSTEERRQGEKSSPADLVLDDFKDKVAGLFRIVLGGYEENAGGDYRLFRRAISNARKRITFSKPIVIVMEEDPDLVIFTHEPTRIFGAGETVRDALKDFEDSFIRIYLSYEETPVEELSIGAIAFSDRLKKMVQRCEDI